MNKPIERTKDNKILAVILIASVFVSVTTLVLLTKKESGDTIEELFIKQPAYEEGSSEEERQFQELQKEMKDFSSLSEEEINEQTRELEDLFSNMTGN